MYLLNISNYLDSVFFFCNSDWKTLFHSVGAVNYELCILVCKSKFRLWKVRVCLMIQRVDWVGLNHWCTWVASEYYMKCQKKHCLYLCIEIGITWGCSSLSPWQQIVWVRTLRLVLRSVGKAHQKCPRALFRSMFCQRSFKMVLIVFFRSSNDKYTWIILFYGSIWPVKVKKGSFFSAIQL